MSAAPVGLRGLSGALARHRRPVAAALAGGAVAAGLATVTADPAPTVPVLAAARDLPGGSALMADDLTTLRLPRALVPRGALVSQEAAEGRTLVGPIRQGEPLTDARLVAPSLLEASGQPEGTVAAPVRIADADAAALLRPGDVVDVLAAPLEIGGGPARTVASRAPVLAVPDPGDTAATVEGALVLLATTPAVAADLARAAVDARLSVIVRAPTG